MQDTCPAHGLRIELYRCSESLDLLENEDELEKVVSWILMMNRLELSHAIDVHGEASYSLEASFTKNEGRTTIESEEKNARNAVADLLSLFDPAEHKVVRLTHGEGNDSVPVALWPRDKGSSQLPRNARPR